MSVRASTWAWEQELPAPEKLLLLALADQSRDDGVLVHFPQSQLAAMTGAATRTVRGNLRKLEERGLLRRFPEYEYGARVPDTMVIAVDGTLDLPADLASGRSCRALLSSITPTSSQEEKKNNEPPGRICRQGARLVGFEAVVPDEMANDAAELLRRKVKVGSQQVSVEEMTRAAASLAAFNEESGSDFGLGAHLAPLVGRIRERPSWDAARLVRLVRSAWRLRWWEAAPSGPGRRGRPTPAVIFGNSRVFEAVAQDAAEEARGEPRRSSAPGRYTRED